MKKMLTCLLLLSICALFVQTDAGDFPYTQVQCIVKISNVSSVPQLMVLAYISGYEIPGSKDYYVREIKDNVPIETFHVDNSLAVFAIRRDLVAQRGGLDKIDFQKLISSGFVTALKIQSPGSEYLPDAQIKIYYEEIVYRISQVWQSDINLEVQEKYFKYSSGETSRRVYVEDKTVRTLTNPVRIERIESSSFLADESYYCRYLPAMAFDAHAETAWSEGTDGPGIGQWVEIKFAQPVQLDKITVSPGWFQEANFKNNNRVKQLTVILDGFKQTATFSDTMKAQEIVFWTARTVSTIRFQIDAVYKGEKWDDTCLAEIAFFYQNKKLELDLAGLTDLDRASSIMPKG